MGMGMVEESSSAAAPTPKMPNLARNTTTSFHLAIDRARNCLQTSVPFRLLEPS